MISSLNMTRMPSMTLFLRPLPLVYLYPKIQSSVKFLVVWPFLTPIRSTQLQSPRYVLFPLGSGSFFGTEKERSFAEGDQSIPSRYRRQSALPAGADLDSDLGTQCPGTLGCVRVCMCGGDGAREHNGNGGGLIPFSQKNGERSKNSRGCSSGFLGI